ncbi:chemotaxis protein CheA [Comamonas testosteroni]|uniref:Chemotaxis protein CheA n=2 Tax=Comamonas TaxID=283 RepID=A0A0L7N8E2_COMTE|nr:Hpt domain-containing protein [Comamonas testosteroni]KOC30295.1 chemotaxis protein CheA [Comamonas testosteroni]KWT73140.1 Signal transduction histidine kinase CheA [Comamonas testosteroni]
MSVVDDSPIRAAMSATAELDLGPLAWVLDEVRKSLEAASKAVNRFMRDADAARLSDLEELDTSALRIARQQLHQACGALEMVGVTAPAQVMRSMEAAVNRFVQRPEYCTQEAATTLERTHFALMEFLEAVLAGQQVSAVALFPQYRETQVLAGNDKAHPADLWPAERRAREPRWTGVMPEPLAYGPHARGMLDGVVLRMVKSDDREAAAQMCELCRRFAAAQPEDVAARSFWKIAAAFFDAQARGLITADIYVKRMASRVLMQYASMAKGDSLPPARLLQDLMFFCAQARPREQAGDSLKAVHEAYAMEHMPAVDYHVARFGRFDPSVLVQARKRIAAAAETWSAVAGGDRSKIRSMAEQFGLVSESLVKLQPVSHGLARALIRVAETVERIGEPPPAELAMEVATAVLYLQASFMMAGHDDEIQAAQSSVLVQRLDAALHGAQSEPLEIWMEELYRQASDQQTMGSVVGELRITLGEAEKHLDLFFRNPSDTSVLASVPGQMGQMRGVLSVLGFEQAATAMQRMRDTVEHLMLGEVTVENQPRIFEKLGSSLGAMGFLIDMLSYQRNMARKLFVYDEEKDELRIVMGHSRSRGPEAFRPTVDIPMEGVPSAQPAVSASATAATPTAAAAVEPSVAAPPPPALVRPVAQPQPLQAGLTDDEDSPPWAATEPGALPDFEAMAAPVVAEPAVAGSDALADAMAQVFADMQSGRPAADDAATASHSGQDLAGPSSAAVAATQPPSASAELSAQELDGDDELLSIFLEEAREVVDNGLQALQALADEPGNLSEQTTLRRAFHTLKGSSRMVGLDEFGEAGWAMEQMLNAWLAEQRPMPQAMQQLAQDALKAFAAWAQDIESQQAQNWSATAFRAAADAMRLQGERADVALVPRRSERAQRTEPVWDVAEVSAAAAHEPVQELPPALAEELEWPPESGAVAAEPGADAQPAQLAQSEPAFAMPELDFSLEDLSAVPVQDSVQEPAPEPESATADFALPQLDIPDDLLQQLAAPELLEASALPTLESEGEPEPEQTEYAAADAVIEAQASAEQSSSAQDVQELDFAAFEAAMRESEQAAIAAQSAMETGPGETASAETASAETASAEMASVETASVDSVVELPSAEAVSELEAIEALLDGVPEPVMAEEPVQAAEPEVSAMEPVSGQTTEEPDDGYRNIDGLRISAALYNVYLNEADDWSERLGEVLQQWLQEPAAAVPDDAIALAHSLAGSSGTVGFKALSELARLLEHALLHLQPQGYASALQIQQCMTASDEVRRLLHQFAAGFLKDALPAVEDALREILNTPIDAGAAADTADLELSDLAELAELDEAEWPEVQALQPPADPKDLPLDFAAELSQEVTEATLPELAGDGLKDVAEEEAGTSAADPLLDVVVQAADPAPYSMVPAAGSVEHEAELQRRIDEAIALAVHAGDDEDDIDVLDQVDADLFPIFEEEAIDLLPKLGAALRRWHGRPTLDEARNEALRALHTIKGSARLAGAMRMGEMAHRLESAVERIDQERPAADAIEPLLSSFDALQASFDVLRMAGEQEPEQPLAQLDDLLAQAPLHLSAAESDVTQAAAQAQAGEKAAADPAQAIELPAPVVARPASQQTVRVRAQLLDRLISQTGEVLIARSRVDARLSQARSALNDLTGNLERLRTQLRDIEVQAESQMQSRLALSKDTAAGFDPLEFDRFTRVQELTRMMAESVNDVATVQRNLQRDLAAAEDDLVAQGRQARDLQRDLLRTRMVEFDSFAERLYAVVRQTSKEMGKQVRLNILGGTIEMDRGMLERMMPAFEHLLRNCVAHGIESPERRQELGKPAVGTIEIVLGQERNDVALSVEDDGAGLDLERIRSKAISLKMWTDERPMTLEDAARLIFEPGFTTAAEVTGVAGRGIGMDVVRSEVNALGGRIETHTEPGRGSAFRLVLPLTTAVTQVVMLRMGAVSMGVPANLVEIVRRVPVDVLEESYRKQEFQDGSEVMPFYWAGALWQTSLRSEENLGRTRPVVIVRSASQRVALHVDEVLGNQEVVIKNLGPQLSRLPGLTGMSVLPSGAVVQIYNPVALANVHGEHVRAMLAKAEQAAADGELQARSGGADLLGAEAAQTTVPLVLVVDDSITVRRVTQRLLQREGYRVTLAADGLQAMERLQDERPTLVLSDIEMPRMDGFDLLRNIRADQKLEGMPVVMITSRIAQKHREMARDLGANHYLGKPYSDEELLGLIQHYALQRSGPAPERSPLGGLAPQESGVAAE